MSFSKNPDDLYPAILIGGDVEISEGKSGRGPIFKPVIRKRWMLWSGMYSLTNEAYADYFERLQNDDVQKIREIVKGYSPAIEDPEFIQGKGVTFIYTYLGVKHQATILKSGGFIVDKTHQSNGIEAYAYYYKNVTPP